MDNLENTYWNSKGRYQYAINVIQKRVPDSGSSDKLDVETFRIAANAYYDYFNNGGCNRHRLTDLKRVHIASQRGTPGTKALTKLKSYAPRDPNNCHAGYMPSNLTEQYEAMMDAVIEDNFPELIIPEDMNSLDTFSVTFENDSTRVLTKNCLLHNYLNNKGNAETVRDYVLIDEGES